MESGKRQNREYQRAAVNATCRYWNHGTRSVCVVCPTGGGKSVMLSMLKDRARAADARVVGVVHRIELVRQLLGHFGPEAAGIGPEFSPDSSKPIQVGTVQSILRMSDPPPADLVMVDECHHYPGAPEAGAMDSWPSVLGIWPKAKIVGATATPGRGDNRPLGDTFQELVVAAQYSDLLHMGHIVPCEVWHPPEQLTKGIAVDPVVAYQRYGQGEKGFVFARDVEHCRELEVAFDAAGIPCAVIVDETPGALRAERMAAFKRGDLRLLINVYCLTEGIDVPDASLCMIARGCASACTYLQMVGRVLRAAAGKTRAILIDLAGACLAHGLPTQDRCYSLDGVPVSLSETANKSLRVCFECGYTYEYVPGPCPRCGFTATPKNKKPRIYDIELRRVYAGENTPDAAKKAELDRLRALAEAQHISTAWVIHKYKELFGEGPPGYMFTAQEKLAEWDRLVEKAKTKGHNATVAYAIFRKTFGCNPPRDGR